MLWERQGFGEGAAEGQLEKLKAKLGKLEEENARLKKGSKKGKKGEVGGEGEDDEEDEEEPEETLDLDQELLPYARGSKQKVLRAAGVLNFKKAHVDGKIKGLQLEGEKAGKAEELGKKLQEKFKSWAKSHIEEATLHDRVEELLVEWGVPPKTFGGNGKADYGHMLRLLAAAVVCAE
ncbi:unnamed protein product [Prorocentrum cordatum]|uniref:Uncharacterized protein n=1 Tax=Prorocentrum cordatum TaxID=2364126 RepID=A0ABN9RZJ6_9DINO|nr:unnamed protein product [Polarella glacialis]